MRNKNYLVCCTALLAIGFAALGCAQQAPQQAQAPQQVPMSPQERQELRDLLRQFDPERPNPDTLPVFEQRWLLIQLKDIAAISLMMQETEKLTVCDTIGSPHLARGDVIWLTRLGASGNVMMEVIRNEGQPNERHPWTNPGGGNKIVLNPSVTGKVPHWNNPSYKKFTPEAVGKARVGTHPDGAPTDHDFFMRRNNRTPDAKCSNPDPLLIQVPEQHTSGTRHGGTAVLD